MKKRFIITVSSRPPRAHGRRTGPAAKRPDEGTARERQQAVYRTRHEVPEVGRTYGADSVSSDRCTSSVRKGLSSWLFATREGHILLNTGTPKSGPMIAASIRKVGFKPEDIKIIINGHGHSDHAGAFAYMKQLSGAQVAIMQQDVAMVEDGGKSDFHYGKDWQVMGQPPVKVDRVLRDGDQVRLGDVVLTALHTPGHTRGATTWTTTLVDSGKAYVVVFPDGGGFNPGYRIAGRDPSYPGIEDDYRRTLQTWEMLKPDIWLAHHTEYFGMNAKREHAANEGVDAWVDPEGYHQFVAAKHRAFEDEVDAQTKGHEGQSADASSV